MDNTSLKEVDRVEVLTLIDNYVDILLGSTEVVTRPPKAKNAEIPTDTLLITYCSGAECESSTDVAALLAEEGYSQVKVLFGGWENWKRAGYPVERVGQTELEPKRDSRLQSKRGLSRREGG